MVFQADIEVPPIGWRWAHVWDPEYFHQKADLWEYSDNRVSGYHSVLIDAE
jgi:hypothetical protein